MRIIILLLFFIGMQVFAQKTPEQSVKDFFVAFHKQDTLALQQITLPNLNLKTISKDKSGDFKVESTIREAFIKSIGSIPKEVKFEEKILDYKTNKDEGFASVWTPYEFYLNGKFSHCGVNQFQLLLASNGTWKIISITDTRRTENCP